MFTRPSRRVNSIAQSADRGSAHYLIACSGAKDGVPCGEMIWVQPSEKSECPHCGKVYQLGYLGHVNPGQRTIQK